jgi:hypothetical protein
MAKIVDLTKVGTLALHIYAAAKMLLQKFINHKVPASRENGGTLKQITMVSRRFTRIHAQIPADEKAEFFLRKSARNIFLNFNKL